MIISFKRRFHQLSNFYTNLAVHSIYKDLSFTFGINLIIHSQTLKQCALYTIMNIKPRAFLSEKYYRNIVDNLE
jgi:hypothetical protein